MDSKALESFLIPEDSIATEDLATYAAGLACAAIAIIGTPILIKDIKTSNKRNKHYKRIHETYKNEITQINQQYGISFNANKMTTSDIKKFDAKLSSNILSDLKKMGEKFNHDKKLCNELADKYFKYAMKYKDDPDFDMNTLQYEVNTIRNGPVNIKLRQPLNNEDKRYVFEVCTLDNPANDFLQEYIHKPFCDAINKKYEKEINIEAMTKMTPYIKSIKYTFNRIHF